MRIRVYWGLNWGTVSLGHCQNAPMLYVFKRESWNLGRQGLGLKARQNLTVYSSFPKSGDPNIDPKIL